MDSHLPLPGPVFHLGRLVDQILRLPRRRLVFFRIGARPFLKPLALLDSDPKTSSEGARVVPGEEQCTPGVWDSGRMGQTNLTKGTSICHSTGCKTLQ